MHSRRVFVGAIAGVTLSALRPAVAAQGVARGAAQRGRRIILLDVNETMLDINTLEPHFARAFGSGQVLREWFSTVLLYSNVASLAGPYTDFGRIGAAALDMVASARGVTLTTSNRDSILGGMRTLPAYGDVRGGLERLRRAGFRLVTLTNSAPAAVEQQLKNAGLSDLFERSFSVDAVKRFKPAPEPYRHVARELGVTTGDLRMVAAPHGTSWVHSRQAALLRLSRGLARCFIPSGRNRMSWLLISSRRRSASSQPSLPVEGPSRPVTRARQRPT